ncbi:hypothetical protein LCGC14_0234850 [marine sediment metagenome]|uniref:Uncharacterized protein n=1 Tax=marine sediment metagenome TaxID=412755 RepID=A0A0F9UD96_9ZZZZ
MKRRQVDIEEAEPWIAAREVSRLRLRQKRWAWFHIAMMILGLCFVGVGVAFGVPEQLAYGVFVGALALGMPAMWLHFTYERAAKVWSGRVFRTPYRIINNAMRCYGEDWMAASVECYESHMGGDCPLCGAE